MVIEEQTNSSARFLAKQAVAAALPIMAGYLVLGIPCGILGGQAGMSLLQVACLSLLFYSGAGQYMIPNMWLSGAPLLSIVASVSLVNTRQILYSASLSRSRPGAMGVNAQAHGREGNDDRWQDHPGSAGSAGSPG